MPVILRFMDFRPKQKHLSALKSVDRISVIDGVVVAVGWCDPGVTPRLQIDDQEPPEQSCSRYARPDVVAVHGGDFAMSGFRLSTSTGAAPDNSKTAVRFNDEVVPYSAIPVANEVQAMRDRFCAEVAKRPGSTLLEIGSRARSGHTYRHLFPSLSEYVGMDIAPGPNVDLVADAHTLSKSVNAQFDFAFSLSVFEHLIMPWVAAYELNKVLKPGGLAFIQSHPAWPLHEVPWDFFRFSKDAWTGLFNKMTGFEIVEANYGIEAAIIPRVAMGGPLQNIDASPTYLLSACIARKTGEPTVDWSCDPSSVYDLKYSY